MGIIRSGVRMSAGELGCTYASLILHDDGQEVTEDKIKALLKAANVETEAYWPGLFCRAFNDFEGGMDKLVTTPALGGQRIPLPLLLPPCVDRLLCGIRGNDEF